MPKNKLTGKELVVFDLDGTLTETKSDMKTDMAAALRRLLKIKKVAVIGGGTYRQFRRQFVTHLACPPRLLNGLFLFPTTATAFYRYDGGWKNVYSHTLSKEQKEKVRKAVKEAFRDIGYAPPEKVYGKTLEDRGSQMSYSFLGQDVVAKLGAHGVQLKKEWTRKNAPLKLKMASLLQKKLPNLEVRAAGYTTIDIVQKGIDKAYGIRQMEKHLRVPVKKMVFVGDALFTGGNDAPAKKTGVQTIAVGGPKDTIMVIKKILDAA